MGQDYALVVLFYEWLVGLSYAFHGLLNVIGYENFATAIGVAEGIASVRAVAALVVFREETMLQEVGLVNLAIGIVLFLFMVWYCIWKGWLNDYLDGMVGNFADMVSVQIVSRSIQSVTSFLSWLSCLRLLLTLAILAHFRIS